MAMFWIIFALMVVFIGAWLLSRSNDDDNNSNGGGFSVGDTGGFDTNPSVRAEEVNGENAGA